MALTRSTSGRRPAKKEESQAASTSNNDGAVASSSRDTSTEASDATATSTEASRSSTEASRATTETRTETQPAAAKGAPQPADPPAQPPSADRRSIRTTSSRRHRLAVAREEALKVKHALAEARVKTIEAEESDEDNDTVMSTLEQGNKRVGEWIDASQKETPAIADALCNEEELEPAPPQIKPPPTQAKEVQPAVNARIDAAAAAPIVIGFPDAAATVPVGNSGLSNPAAATTGRGGHSHLAAEAPVYTPAPPTRSQEKYEESRELPPLRTYPKMGSPAPLTQNVNLSELASAIALAARTGQRDSRYHIELPPYSGSYQEWLSFKAAYDASAPTYSEADNVARLRKSLKGRAKEAVENLLIYQARTEDILKSLESRFGRPDAIALAELERLRALPRLTDAPREICVFASRVANIIATLRALDRAHYLFSPETTKVMLEKLTPTLRYRWFDYAAAQRTGESELVKISTFLQREAEFCAPYAPPESVADAPNAKRTQKAFAAVEKPSNKCPCCSADGHQPEKCPKFIEEDVNARWKTAKAQRLCFRCLRYRNRTHTCKRIKCEQDNCEHFHHKLLHYKKPEEKTTESVTSTWAPRESRAYLKILPIEISGPAGVVHTYALLDDGSTVTLLHEDVAIEAGLEGPTEPLEIEAITDKKIDASTSRRVAFNIRGVDQTYKIYARTLRKLQLSSQSIGKEDLQGCDHLRDIEGQLKYESATPKVLIGQDNWHLLIGSEVRRGRHHQPIASYTRLGWVLHGAHTRSIGKQVHTINNVTVKETVEEEMNEKLSEYFALENLCIEPKRPQSDPSEQALTKLAATVTINADGRYEVPLLWKNEDAPLPENYENTLKRLHSIEKKLDRDEKMQTRYNDEMNALISKGYAEPAPPLKTKRVWYLPHFAVLNPMKPDKVRIVHDAAAKTRGVSLNDRLLTGPDLLQSLPGVLMRFRQHPVALGADISEMFMQVKVKPEDRDMLRYLWRGDRRDDAPPAEFRMTSLIFGATCSPSIAIYIKNTNAEKFEKTHPDAVKAIIKNHYVDDYLQSFKTEEEAIQTASDVHYIHSQAHYELRKWTSNSTRVLESIVKNAAQPENVELSKTEMKNERVLGQIWKPSTDEIAFNLDLTRLPPGALDDKEPTKRHVLKILMSVFDPLGLATPVTINAKKILQEVWRRGTGWDDKLDADLAQQWTEWTHHLKSLRGVAIPRCYPHYSDAARRELHVFVDSSESAYTCALYWRVTTPDGQVHVSLIAAKAKVAPLRLVSVPRLELQAAVLGSRMAAAIIEEHDLKPEKRTFWSDSRTVLAWIRTGARTYRPFVAHRIAAIEENTKINEWRWVPTKMNVADEATREVPEDFNSQHRWYTGPEFLRADPSTWPAEPQQLHSEKTGEEKVHTLAVTRQITPALRFSRWEKLLRTTGRVLQFIDLCRPQRAKTYYKRTSKNKQIDPDWQKSQKHESSQSSSRNLQKGKNYKLLDASYLKKAERLIMCESQIEVFSEELKCLLNNKPPGLHSRLRPLAVELVNGMIVLKTRIDATADITEAQKRPPVLDGNHPAVKLYIDYVHRQLCHSGVEATLNECRQYYHILRLRPVTKMVLHRCLPCRIRKATPPVPPTGDHPRTRLAHHERPFTYTGLDYFGPLTVTVGRGKQKRYVALFTCLTVRAVHLEVVPSLSADSAVMALRRMIARRGCPTELWSDNGSNFHAADKELRQAFGEALQLEATKRLITWRFIPPGAPFMGGAWERLVGATKSSLKAVLNGRHPSDETLATLIAEAEYTVNSRPLTHVSVTADEPEAITPNHFLLGGSARVPTTGTFDDSVLVGRATWRTSQRLADHFWSRWLREYLPTLQYRREPHGRGPAIEVGNVVLIADGTLPRNTWPRGRVVATYPGADGVTRVVDVQTRCGVLRRPTKKLVILPTEPTEPADLQP